MAHKKGAMVNGIPMTARAARIVDEMGIAGDNFEAAEYLTFADLLRWPRAGRRTVSEIVAAINASGRVQGKYTYEHGCTEPHGEILRSQYLDRCHAKWKEVDREASAGSRND